MWPPASASASTAPAGVSRMASARSYQPVSKGTCAPVSASACAVTAPGAALKAGLKKGDVLVEVDGQSVKTTGDVRVALWDKKPGQHVVVEARRGRWLANTEHKFDVELAAPTKGPVEP